MSAATSTEVAKQLSAATAMSSAPPPAAGEDVPPPSSSPPSSSTLPCSSSSLPPPPPSAPVGVLLRQRPAVPPKPQLDVVRFSMAQAKDEIDLDTILSELLELEHQLMSGDACDGQLLLGMSSSADKCKQSQECHGRRDSVGTLCAAPVEQLAKRVQFQAFQEKPDSSSSASSSSASSVVPTSADPCASPDADSAFGDSSSTESTQAPSINAPKCSSARGSEFSSAESFRGSLLNTPSPTHQQISSSGNGHFQQRPPSSAASYTSSAVDEQKAAKIREALEKMKEAKMKKVFVKVFLEDGAQRGILIDERWTVAETMRQLADKLNMALTSECAIVEELPHLHIQRVYEDHEHVVENLEDWTSDSPNKLHFVRVPNKWTLFRRPQHFLLSDRNRNDFASLDNASGTDWDAEQKQLLLNSFLREDAGARVPELEGWLLLKADGKKCWRRHFFVLRASGLYYVPKPGKPRGPTRDLHCLMSVFNNQVYTCTDWRKKYKAPSDFGFAIKHPRVQLKTSKYIKYICCEDEHTFRQWLTALRIIKNGCPQLHKNFCASQSRWRSCPAGPSTPVRVEVPQVSLQRLSTLDPNFSPRKSIASSPATTIRGSFMPSGSSPVSLSMNELPGSRTILRVDSPPHIMFEQDDQCNTIKRQPDGLRQWTSSTTPSTSNATVTVGHQSAVVESDSDEEQFPPPPPMESFGTTNETQNPHNRIPGGSPRKQHQPPPPPKRAEGTRLQTTPPMSGHQQLMAELQQRQRTMRSAMP